MPVQRPDKSTLIGKDVKTVPMSCQRILETSEQVDSIWIGPNEAISLTEEEAKQYQIAENILCHLAVQAPRAHSSGHPGGSLSAFTLGYFINKERDLSVDQPLRMSAGHLSILAYGLEWLFGRGADDKRLNSPNSIIETFRTPDGLPGHVEAGIGSIPFGTGPLGKGPSNALGVAFGLKHQNKKGIVDVILADGDAQEGQVYEAFRLASNLKLDNLVVHGDFNDIQLSTAATEVFASDFSAMAVAAGSQVIEVQDGNNPDQVSTALKTVNDLVGKGKPIFVCYYTTMGNGIDFMEEASNTGGKNYHGAPLTDEEAEKALAQLPPLNDLIKSYEEFRGKEQKRYEANPSVETNILVKLDMEKLNSSGYKRTITDAKGAARKDFGAVHVLNLMKADDRILVLHADLAGSGGFSAIEKELPERIINVGVAEANMYMMAAGMRQTGLLPITYTFSAFGTNEARANARLIDINCGHTKCGVIHDCTHTGLSVGEDGETHQERNYLNIPLDHTQVWLSADCNQAAAMAERAIEISAKGEESVYTFFPRDGHEQLKSPDGSVIYSSDYIFDGKADLIRGNGDTTDQVTVIATGIPVHSAVEAADELSKESDGVKVRVLNISCVRPIDSASIIQAAIETGHLIVVEDHNNEGGLASHVSDIVADFNLPCSVRKLGVNRYFPSAKAKDLYFMAGIDPESIQNAIEDEVRTEVCGGEDAFVTAISEISNNLKNSRFKNSAKPFVSKLLTEKGYCDSLREFWANRECPKDNMPTNDDLIKKIEENLS
ncbi:hypothetical protein HN682_06195 [Candidatus Peregrinibacteria bacterium]|nr:hypothetical protein [Candidatus Peregrinibacteria bacterium]